MVILGLNVLGNLNKPATSPEALGHGFWRIVIGSGILIFILGWLNVFASFIFRDARQGITARQVRAHGAVAIHKTPKSSSITSAPYMSPKSQVQIVSPAPVTPRNPASNPFRLFTGSDRHSVLPSYHTNSPAKFTSPGAVSPTSKYSRATNCSKKMFGLGRDREKRESVGPQLPINISAPLYVNPQFAHLVKKPQNAVHPSGRGESEAYRWRT
ncbi:hypothetical protein LTR66_009304 [Elasticomyces elasticus]|nr:hypothetical protein LTR28_002766 [Elasticomyces elasticus]KAK4982377.1 hypothetical protein LTR66_009304 [Elasticomyces elasticus]